MSSPSSSRWQRLIWEICIWHSKKHWSSDPQAILSFTANYKSKRNQTTTKVWDLSGAGSKFMLSKIWEDFASSFMEMSAFKSLQERRFISTFSKIKRLLFPNLKMLCTISWVAHKWLLDPKWNTVWRIRKLKLISAFTNGSSITTSKYQLTLKTTKELLVLI